MSTNLKRFQGIDWPRVWKTLRVRAETLVGSAALVFDCGISAEDLAVETLEAFFLSENGLGWQPAKGSIEGFLCGVLKNKFIDHFRRDQHLAGPIDDETFKDPSASPLNANDPHKQLSYQEFADQIRSLVRGNRELEDFIAATELTDGAHNVNQQLADIMEISASEVVNRRKRLLRVPGMKELYEKRRGKEKEV